jgi:hypothetical protein
LAWTKCNSFSTSSLYSSLKICIIWSNIKSGNNK